jgi:hypothetical protein
MGQPQKFWKWKVTAWQNELQLIGILQPDAAGCPKVDWPRQETDEIHFNFPYST